MKKAPPRKRKGGKKSATTRAPAGKRSRKGARARNGGGGNGKRQGRLFADAPSSGRQRRTPVDGGARGRQRRKQPGDGARPANGGEAAGAAARATAVTLGAKQREISVSEFFAKNRHLLGFDNPRKALLTAVKEAVDNALDACEEAGILPDISVEIVPVRGDRYRIKVEDNGPGIVKAQIPKTQTGIAATT